MPTVRKSVLCSAEVAAYPAANTYLAGFYGDDPGTDEMAGRYYLDGPGADPTAPTHRVMCSPSSTVAEANAFLSYFTTQPGCAGWSADRVTPNPDFNAIILAQWGLKPCAPVTP